MLSICKQITGSEKYLTYSEKSWSWNYSSGDYLFGGCDYNSIEPFLRIHGIELKELIEKKYKVMAAELNLKRPNYVGLIGGKFKDILSKRTLESYYHLMDLMEHKYTEFYFDTNEWLWTLSGAPLDLVRYNSLKKLGNSINIRYSKDLTMEPVRYDRSKIKTGRLSVIQGPQVMTMNADWRNIAKNCRQMDFSSMEPRFLLNVSGQEVNEDLYEWVAKKANLKGDRSYTKIAILSSMYGSARQVPEVTKLFALEEWERQLEANVHDDVIENYYGRPIRTGGVKGRHLLSLWLQSSAADAAIKGFADFFRNNNHLKPHWIIHDGCVFSGEGKVPNEIIIDDMKFPIKTGAV